MNLALDWAGLVLLLLAAPLTVSAERRVKAWAQLRRGLPFLQPYHDLRKLWGKDPLAPLPASPLYVAVPWLALGCLLAALLMLPVMRDDAGLGGNVGLLVLALLLTLQRGLMAAQAFDTTTPFGGLGSSRELFLGGVGEPVFLMTAAAVYLQTGTAGIPTEPLSPDTPATWLILGALVFVWLAEAARIPFDNPATHLELTMVHEAMLLESSGWRLAFYETLSAIKQALLGTLLLLFFVPFPEAGPMRLGLIIGGVVLLSAVLALLESGIAKVRLFRASHLLVMGALLAFLASVVAYLERGPP